MNRSLVLSAMAALSLAVGAPVLAQPPPAPSTAAAPSTSDFITAAAQTDDFERQSGRIAEHSSHRQRVRTFGAMMVADHTKTTEHLKAAIHKAGLTAPSPHLTNIQIQMLNALRLSIAKPLFDHTYIDQQVSVHRQALALMQSYAEHGENATLRAAAANIVPIVQHHLAVAEAIQKSVD